MEIMKEAILDFAKNNNERNDYIILLYKNYVAFNNIFSETSKSKVKILKTYEDEIYKISDKILSEKNRIKLELNQMKTKINKNIDKYGSLLNNYYDIEKHLETIDFSDSKEILNVKKDISILQAKLDIKPSFFLASYLAFEDLYRNIYINYIKEENYGKKRSFK